MHDSPLEEDHQAKHSASKDCVCRCHSSPHAKVHQALHTFRAFTKLDVGQGGSDEECLNKGINKHTKRAALGLSLATKILPWKPQALKMRLECNLCRETWRKYMFDTWKGMNGMEQKRMFELLENEAGFDPGIFSDLIDLGSETQVSREDKKKMDDKLGEVWNKIFDLDHKHPEN